MQIEIIKKMIVMIKKKKNKKLYWKLGVFNAFILWWEDSSQRRRRRNSLTLKRLCWIVQYFSDAESATSNGQRRNIQNPRSEPVKDFGVPSQRKRIYKQMIV